MEGELTFVHLQADVNALPLADNSADALLCDPPYGLGFMGKAWDRSVPPVEAWREVFRVLKPGAFGLVFGGTRTFPFLAVNLVEAGFELRDTIYAWIYGSGFPKSTNVGKALDKAAGREREVVGQRVRLGDQRDYETRGRSVFAGEETGSVTVPATPEAARWEGRGSALKPSWEPVLLIRRPIEPVTREELYALTGWRYWVTVTSRSKDLPKNEKLETLRYRPLAPGLREARFYFHHVTRKRRVHWSVLGWEALAEGLQPDDRGYVTVEETVKMTYVGSRSEADGRNWSTNCNQANALKWGTGALWIDGGRVEGAPRTTHKDGNYTGNSTGSAIFPMANIKTTEPAGRWPANVVLSHTPECRLRGVKRVKSGIAVQRHGGGQRIFNQGDGLTREDASYVGPDGLETVEDWACEPSCPVRLLDEQSGELTSGTRNGNKIARESFGGTFTERERNTGYFKPGDAGGASRFFYCAKASPAERNAGLEGLEERESKDRHAYDGLPDLRMDHEQARRPSRNHHPTVKPIALCRWLATLLLPPARAPEEPPRTLLVPFAGSGSEMIGAHLAGWDRVVGVEIDPEYVEIQRRRCEWWAEHGAPGVDTATILAEGAARSEEKQAGQLELTEVE